MGWLAGASRHLPLPPRHAGIPGGEAGGGDEARTGKVEAEAKVEQQGGHKVGPGRARVRPEFLSDVPLTRPMLLVELVDVFVYRSWVADAAANRHQSKELSLAAANLAPHLPGSPPNCPRDCLPGSSGGSWVSNLVRNLQSYPDCYLPRNPGRSGERSLVLGPGCCGGVSVAGSSGGCSPES
jgi:hypothetical protein